MKYTWFSTWVAKPHEPSRRKFLVGSGAAMLLAPAVVHSGILMPVRKLILPEARTLLTQRITVSLEGSIDGENWFPIVRAVGHEGIVLKPENFPLLNAHPKQFRQILTPEWVGRGRPDVNDPAYAKLYGRMARLYDKPPCTHEQYLAQVASNERYRSITV